MAKKFRGGYGGGGGIPNMGNLMKQAQKMQEQMQKAQEELDEAEIMGSSGGGLVTVAMNGKKVVNKISIKKEAVDPDDIEMLEDLLMAAYNDAAEQADEMYEEKMGPLGKMM